MDGYSLIATGKARELLAQLRRNLRFSRWTGSFSPNSTSGPGSLGPLARTSGVAAGEHEFVQKLKHLRRIQTQSDIGDMLAPFLEIIRSPEANGLITSAALTAVEEILRHAHRNPALRMVVSDVVMAVASCRFEPTDSKVDEVVLSQIVEVIIMSVTGSTAPSLTEEALFAAFETCFRLTVSKRASPVIVSIAIRALSCIAIAAVEAAPNAQVLANSADEPTYENVAQKLKAAGPASFSFERRADSKEQRLTLHPLRSIMLLASCLVDPAARQSTSLRMTGLQILQSCLEADATRPEEQRILVNSEPLRNILLRDVSLALLRTLGLVGEPGAVIASAFSAVLTLLHVQGRYGSLLLNTLLVRVFPQYVRADRPGGKTPPANREVALEALAAVFSEPGLLSVAFAAIDCDPHEPDAVAPLIGEAAQLVESAVHELNRLSTASQDAYDNAEETWSSIIAPGLLCADALLSLADWLGKRVDRSGSSARPAKLEHLLAVKARKNKCATAAEEINARKDKAKAKDVLRVLSEHQIYGNDADAEGNGGADGEVSADRVRLVQAAKFFRETPSMEKAVIGTVLGEPDEQSKGILSEYTNTFDFTGMSITTAVRVFLESFRLPGEAQKIDRIMHSFANQYYGQNEGRTEVKSEDVAFVLAYAIVMLNTDQHNDSVKRKMSLDDFVRNNRGMNSGEDFSRTFLEDIFASINEVEIKISSEAGVDELNEHLWTEALQSAGFNTTKAHAKTAEEPRLLPEPADNPDSEVFRMAWPSVVLSSKVVLNHAADENDVHRAIEGFLSVARCSETLKTANAVDECIFALGDACGLCAGPLKGSVFRFGVDVRAQLSFVALAGIVRKCRSGLREKGWIVFLSCAIRLHSLGLLSSPALDAIGGYSADLVGSPPDEIPLPPSPLQPEWWPSKLALIERNTGTRPRAIRRNKAESNSFWALLGVGGANAADKDNPFRLAPSYLLCESPAEEEAHKLAQKSVQACRLDEILLSENLHLQAESLAAYTSAMKSAALAFIRGQEEEDQDSRWSWSVTSILDDSEETSREDLDEARLEAVSFVVDLLTEVMLRNVDGIDIIWPKFFEISQWLLASATRTDITTERATVGLLRAAVGLLHLEAVRDDVLRELNLLVKMNPQEFAPLAPPVGAGILRCLRAHAVHIVNPSGWHTLLSLIERLHRYPNPSPQLGFESLQYLASHETQRSAIALETFSQFLDAVYVYAASPSANSAPALDLFGVLARRIAELRSDLPEDEPSHAALPHSWEQLWSPLLQGISDIVLRSPAPDIQLYAVSVVEWLLASNESEKLFTAAECRLAIEVAIVPTVKNLFEESQSRDGTGKLRQKAITLVLKGFLQHHMRLYGELQGEEFLRLWLTVLETTAGTLRAGDSVSEYVVESLKNVVLVMQSNGVLSETDEVLWRETTEAFKRLSPALFEEMFPTSTPANDGAEEQAPPQPEVGDGESQPAPQHAAPVDEEQAPEPDAADAVVAAPGGELPSEPGAPDPAEAEEAANQGGGKGTPAPAAADGDLT